MWGHRGGCRSGSHVSTHSICSPLASRLPPGPTLGRPVHGLGPPLASPSLASCAPTLKSQRGAHSFNEFSHTGLTSFSFLFPLRWEKIFFLSAQYPVWQQCGYRGLLTNRFAHDFLVLSKGQRDGFWSISDMLKHWRGQGDMEATPH